MDGVYMINVVGLAFALRQPFNEIVDYLVKIGFVAMEIDDEKRQWGEYAFREETA
jgi:hypothetical protein